MKNQEKQKKKELYEFADRLRSKRKKFGWTQAQAAERISIHGYLNYSENGYCGTNEDRYQRFEQAHIFPGRNELKILTELFSLDNLYDFI